ncbi:acyltransferase [Brumicola nitratireducens]|uniref:Phospholipid/glycerol acyltransferase n=1 Tax=Glaciecola nitratireducens (strain JCM 12485 / KCTC 12276 / FR1064) TaxID=1085623 RepID=G4QJ83_GLANF|nr:acyltransferase [Glaciecola nitratireducens]AEP28951.1 phospholipid/glycerol acyltransferase [Glaciecola nitratireducens FR1064]
MLHFINGCLSALGYFINTVFWVIPIIILSLLKVIPIKPWQKFISFPLDGCATTWISINNINQNIFSRTRFNTKGLEGLTTKEWYLVISNHQSWVDILVLQRVFNRKIPFLKFFLKKELIWVPFIGIAWWALDFPFMRRYSKAFLTKNPHLKGKDLETTKKACEKFQHKPVSVMNFIEGTRFTEQKRQQSGEIYSKLLPPKAGGIAFVLSAMGERLTRLVDVTIHYPEGTPSYWDFVSGKVSNIDVSIKTVLIDDLFTKGIFSASFFDDPEQKKIFQEWLNQMWQNKNAELESMEHSNK